MDMRHELNGHPACNRIHGGMVSAGLDAMAGLIIMAAIGARHMDETLAQRMFRFSTLGTIALQVDYLRPAVGGFFELRAKVLRLGSRVASTRMAVSGANDQLLPAGSGDCVVS